MSLFGKKRANVAAPAEQQPAKDWQWVLGQDKPTLERAARRRKALMQSRITLIFALVFFLIATLAIGVPWFMQWRSSVESAEQANKAANVVASWPYPKAKLALEAAEQYNAKLAQGGQPTLGETYDPFDDDNSESDLEDIRSDRDKEYTSLLNAGDSVMGSIVIPKISVNLPIRHGTSQITLSRGTGHLYGTSLPTGGASTHTVITGHRGLVEAEMFTRLDEMRVGDFMYEKVFGRTLAYRVDRITVIEPTDSSQLRIVPGEDRLTLMTCTPFGINTHRLLVSGTRVAMPVPAPAPENAGKDMAKILRWSVIVAGIAAIVLFLLYRLLPPFRRTRRVLDRRMKHRSADADNPNILPHVSRAASAPPGTEES